jgi:hypothetical protein
MAFAAIRHRKWRAGTDAVKIGEGRAHWPNRKGGGVTPLHLLRIFNSNAAPELP